MASLRTLITPRRALFAAVATTFFCASFACPVMPVHAQKGKGKFKGDDVGDVVIKSNPKFLAAFKEVVAKPSQSVVRVQCDKKDVSLGVVITADGFVLTKFSDLTDNITVKTQDGKEHEASIIGVHEKHDLAMLKIYATDLKPITLTDSKSTPAGHLVASAGMGSEPIAAGVVSVPTRNVAAGKGPPPAPTNPNSGFLGVSLGEDGSVRGARVTEVQAKSAAEKAGIKANDLIVAVAGKMIEDANSLITTLQRYKVKDTVELKVKRGEEELELKAILGPRPANQANRGDVQNNMGSELSKRRTGFPTILQSDQVIKPSDCGGPLVDLEGHVIGINIARAGRVESYAIPSEVIRPLLNDLMSGKLAPPNSKKEKAKDQPKEKDKEK